MTGFSLRRFVTILRWLLLAKVCMATAWADGKVLAPVLVPQDVAMPDQRALLAWRDGVQTLVIESAFVGTGTDFAWVVPLPAKPTVEAATSGTLASAAALMTPRIPHVSGELWVILAIVGAVAGVALGAGWAVVGWIMRVMLAASLGLVIGIVLVAMISHAWLVLPVATLASCWCLRDLIRGGASLFQHLIVLIVVLLASALMIPTMGKVRSVAGATSETKGVSVETSIVGAYDVAVLSGTDGNDVTAWLELNGYALGSEARSVAVEHAAKGGWFVASRVRRELAEAGRGVPAPLVFRFPAAEPIYPMRFTGAGVNRPLELELLVFGPSRAEAADLATVAWAPLRFESGDGRGYGRGIWQPDDTRVVTHPQLSRLAEGCATVTKLRGTLSPSAMQTDIFPRWSREGETSGGLVVHSRDGAMQTAMALAVGIALIGAVVLGFLREGRRPKFAASFAVLCVAVIAGAVTYARTPRVEARELKDGIPWYDRRQIVQAAILALGEMSPDGATEETVRVNVEKAIRHWLPHYGDAAVSFGDGPEQLDILRLPNGKWRVMLYDHAGQAGFSEGDDIELGSLGNAPAVER